MADVLSQRELPLLVEVMGTPRQTSLKRWKRALASIVDESGHATNNIETPSLLLYD